MSYPPSYCTQPASLSPRIQNLDENPKPPVHAPSYRSQSPSGEPRASSQFYRSESTIGNPNHSFLRLSYGTRKGMSVSPETHVELENTIRRVFNIPDNLELVLSTELPAFENARVEFDPQIWHLIRSQAMGIWIETAKRIGDKQKSWKGRMKELFGSKIASTSTSTIYSPNPLRLFYDQRAIITMSPDEPTSLEQAARRLFRLPENRRLILFAELPEMGAERLEIDPHMWNIIKLQVTDVWIQVGEIDLFHPSTKRAKALYSSDALYRSREEKPSLPFSKGELFAVLDDSGGTWQVVNAHGQTGSIEGLYLKLL